MQRTRAWFWPTAWVVAPAAVGFIPYFGLPNLPAITVIGSPGYADMMFLINAGVTMAYGWAVLSSVWHLCRGADDISLWHKRIGVASSVFFVAWLPLLYVVTSFYGRLTLALMARGQWWAIGLGIIAALMVGTVALWQWWQRRRYRVKPATD